LPPEKWLKATANPFPADNDKWLADSLDDLRNKDVEYKRLATEDAREKWENAARANLVHQRALEQQRQDPLESEEASGRLTAEQSLTSGLLANRDSRK